MQDFVRVEKEQNLTLDWYGAILNRTGPGVFTDSVEEYLKVYAASFQLFVSAYKRNK